MKFETIEDLEEWLEPFDYETFWREIEPFCLLLEPRKRCDAQIEAGAVSEDDALEGLKYLARFELTRILRLERRPLELPEITWH